MSELCWIRLESVTLTFSSWNNYFLSTSTTKSNSYGITAACSQCQFQTIFLRDGVNPGEVGGHDVITDKWTVTGRAQWHPLAGFWSGRDPVDHIKSPDAIMHGKEANKMTCDVIVIFAESYIKMALNWQRVRKRISILTSLETSDIHFPASCSLLLRCCLNLTEEQPRALSSFLMSSD